MKKLLIALKKKKEQEGFVRVTFQAREYDIQKSIKILQSKTSCKKQILRCDIYEG